MSEFGPSPGTKKDNAYLPNMVVPNTVIIDSQQVTLVNHQLGIKQKMPGKVEMLPSWKFLIGINRKQKVPGKDF